MTLVREFAVSVFAVRHGRILLHQHKRLNRWLPPGGHLEPNETPDDAAVREVFEETGVEIELTGDQLNTANEPDQPFQLVRPMGMQLATIADDHHHMDFVYFARGLTEGDGRGVWFSQSQLDALNLTEEVAGWSALALQRLE